MPEYWPGTGYTLIYHPVLDKTVPVDPSTVVNWLRSGWVQVSESEPTEAVRRDVVVVRHGATAGYARLGLRPHLWIGSVNPTDVADDDQLIRTDTGANYVRTAGAWVAIGAPVAQLAATGAADESASILAALTAVPSTGGVVRLSGVFKAANITIPNKQNLTIDMTNAVIEKNANGPVFTTPAGGWGKYLTFVQPHIDCKGATYTGGGIAVGASTPFLNIDQGYIIGATTAPLTFAVDGGAQCDVNGTLITVYLGQDGQANAAIPAITLPLDTTAPNRGFRGIRTDACLLVEDAGSQDSRFASCEARNINITGNPAKFYLTGCRLASVGAPVTVRGTQCVIVGNAFAGNLVLGGTMSNSTVTGNVIAGDLICNSGTVNNVVAGNRPSSGVVTDSGTNIVLDGSTAYGRSLLAVASTTALAAEAGLVAAFQPNAVGYRSGSYYSPKGATSTTRSYANNRGFVVPMWIRSGKTFDQVSVEVTAAGGAGTLFRVGIWATHTDGLPGALLYDTGVSGSASSVLGNGFVDGTSATAQTITISWAATPRLVWLGLVCQSMAGTPSVRAFLGSTEPGLIPDVASGAAGSINNALFYDSLSGALGSLAGVAPSITTTGPHIALRAA